MKSIWSVSFQAITLLAAMGAVAALAAQNPDANAERHVTVCMEGNADFTTVRARSIASQMFERIGVTIDWRIGLRGCPSQGVMVTLGLGTPAGFKREALAYALPYEGTHVRVFYDRIRQTYNQATARVVLAHVLVHEITHILQGVPRHSDHGIMKARWDAEDYLQMMHKPLEFANEDIDLIYRGIAARTARALAAMNPAPEAVLADNRTNSSAN